MRLPSTLILCLLTLASHSQARTTWRMSKSLVKFSSEAPLETIKAANTKSTGILDPGARTFVVQIPVTGFEGFNSPLQREHFNENYMATDTWPKAFFQGRIIEAVDLSEPGTHAVRAKGTLTIRDVERERIIPCSITITSEGMRVVSDFDVVLDEHGIRIPRVVQQKISPIVQVNADLFFKADADHE